MHLCELSVFKNGEILRAVKFKKGLNLIVNAASDGAKSGNSVGKSTPSRLLDYIFLSGGEDIYTEPEFGKVIPEVHGFISNNSIYVELSFSGHDSKMHLIGRTLTSNQRASLFYIDRVVVDKARYVELVAKQVFGQLSDKPSIRTLSHKFIRNTNEKMQNTTRFLHVTTKPDVYDQLYLFLFGFVGLDLLREKASLNNQINTKTKHLAAYRSPHRESVLQKMISPLLLEKKALEVKIENFDFTDGQESSVKQLVEVQGKISDLTIEYSGVNSRIEYLVKSIASLKGDTAKVDGRELSDIYADAGVAISGELRKSYEDLVVFHNAVVSSKVGLISRDLERLKSFAALLRDEINSLHESESGIFKEIKEPDTLKSIGQIYNNLSGIKEQIASISTLLDQIEDAKKFIATLEGLKSEIVAKISSNTAALSANVEKFNEYFGGLSKLFYGDRYIFDLEFDVEQEKCRFEIASVTPNSTGGKKKGELSAFDLAYIEFVNFVKLKRPTFVVHDSIEDVDVNQVFDIFQMASVIDGQYIVALLSDKISDDKFAALKADSIILELSETDKFFRI